MCSVSLRQAELPGIRPLFADLLYSYPRVGQFYHHPPSLEAAQSAASAIELGARHRQGLVDELARQNRDGDASTQSSLDRLARPGTVVVATGQQVGLLGGPVFTLYKALTAVRCAEELTRRGTPATPVFWLATEDHDLAEVNHAWAYSPTNGPQRIEARTTGAHSAAVGTFDIVDAGLAEFEACCEGLPYAAEAVAFARSAYADGTGFGEGFRTLYSKLLEGTGILFLCPLAAGIRQLAVPVLRNAIERAPELADALIRRGGGLKSAGYHEQVYFQESTSLLMLFESAERIALKRKNSSFLSHSRVYSSDDLVARLENSPLDVSPSALLRPVMQDFLLPTAALIAGPSEAAYLAQSSVLYDKLLNRMPAVLPRATFSVVDSTVRKLLEKYSLTATECLVPRREFDSAISNSLVPSSLREKLGANRAEIEGGLQEIESALLEFDPTLAASFGRSRKKIDYQLEKSNGKVAREALRRATTAQRHAATLADWIYPNENLQERVYCVLSLVAKFGPQFVDEVRAQVELDKADHKVLFF